MSSQVVVGTQWGDEGKGKNRPTVLAEKGGYDCSFPRWRQCRSYSHCKW